MQPWNQLYRELKRYKEEGEVARKNGRGERGKEREREKDSSILKTCIDISWISWKMFSPLINGFSFADPLFSGLLVKQ